ncbi:carbohydrate kinase family protein [Aestuariivirga sp.]|uniref:carbohydrate kinase family protein n=1 Tax=Aestuariivirga sp. TaxID=2650926 RepID=UPI0039E3E736
MARVIVIGGANADIKGHASRSFVGGTSNPGDVSISAGGVGRNIADNLARLGHETSLITVLGDDANGLIVREACHAAGVDLSLTLTGPHPTGTYLVVLDHRGELVAAVNDMRSIEWLKVEHLEALAPKLAEADFLVADCNIGATCLAWLCDFSSRNNIPLLIEPVSVPKAKKLLQFKRQQQVFAITPNLQQLLALTGEKKQPQAIARLHAVGFENIIVHLGRNGAHVSGPQFEADIAPLKAEAVADVTGAGDAAVAGVVCGFLEGLPLPKAAQLGQAAASVKLVSRELVPPDLTRARLKDIAGF